MGEIGRKVRLSEFRVSRLFGEFDHVIRFNCESRITGLIGPNGIGKTVCLKLINALFQMQLSVFSSTEFDRVEFEFTDKTRVTISHQASRPTETNDAKESTGEVSDTLGLIFELRSGDSEPDIWKPRQNDNSQRFARLEAFLPFLTRTRANSYRHDGTRQIFTQQEVLESFGAQLPDQVMKALTVKPPPAFDALISQIDCHLIETQRLLIFQPDDSRRNANASRLAISKKARNLYEIIESELATYAAESQSLDRSFPKRVLAIGSQYSFPNSKPLSERLQELEIIRGDLEQAGILDADDDNEILNTTDASDAITTVLSVYEEDTRKKLLVLEKLRSRISLFKELIDARFYPKYVFVNKTIGFSVKRSNDIDVPLDNLSSGEQHQLVLFFELLFELDKNALILIDEPELSLHVAWQRHFIPDLQRIISLNQFDVLLATHSPQLIGEWDELLVELGDVEL